MLWIILFALSTGAVVYILLGYPALLYILARMYSNPVRRSPATPQLSMIIAVHNGAELVESKLRSIFALDYPQDHIRIIIACDGCTDATAEVAERVGGNRVEVLRLPKGGKAVALNAGMRIATGELFVFTDIRQTFDPLCLRYLVESFADPKVSVVSAHLIIRDSKSREEAAVSLYWQYEFWIRTQLSRIDSFFGATGACYAIRSELAVPIPPNTLLDDMYEPLAAFFRGYRLITDERACIYDFPTKLDAEFDRKVRTLAGNLQIIAAYPQLLGFRNRLWIHFMSYKFGRLLLPFALILIAISSFGLPRPLAIAALSAQFLVYILALFDDSLTAQNPVKKVSSVCRTFCVLIMATLVAIVRTLAGHSAQDLWRPTSISQGK